MVTIRDVAKESGFSSTTVSIVLNNAPLSRYIPPKTKKRIERAAQKLGYRPNQFARSLRSKRSHTVGVMVFDMTDPYCTRVSAPSNLVRKMMLTTPPTASEP